MIMDLKFSFAVQHSPRAFILASVDTKRLLFWNDTAEKLYGIHENTKSLEDLFVNCPMSLHDMTLKMMKEHSPEKKVSFFPDLFTTTLRGDEQLADLLMGFMTEDLSEVFFELTPKEDTREEFAIKMVNTSAKPMFLADFNEDLTIYYGNENFYKIFCKGQEAFETSYKNSFHATMQDENKTDFWKDVVSTLQTKAEFHRDIQITMENGAKKWFFLEFQIIPIGGGLRKLLGMMIPINDRMEVVNQLENMNRYLAAIQDLTSGALFYINPETGKAEHHSKLLKEHGFPNQMDQFPKSIFPMIHGEDHENLQKYFENIRDNDKKSLKLRYQVGKDTYSWAKLATVPIFNDEDKLVEIVGKIENIDEEMNLLERATTDPLTNAYNKEFMEETLLQIMEETDAKTHHALFFLDLDNFKYVNDNLGHQYGDFVLKELGTRMFSCVRDNDFIGRVGGDEFLIFIRNIPNFDMLKNRARKILDMINLPFDDGTTVHTMGGSVGISVFPDHGKTYDELYRNADIALYRSKKRGKNMATIYKPEKN